MAECEKHREEVLYRLYITDCLRQISENTAPICRGKYMQKRWIDLYNPPLQDKRTGEEIASDVIKRAGLVVLSR